MEHARRDEHGLRAATPAVSHSDSHARLASGYSLMSFEQAVRTAHPTVAFPFDAPFVGCAARTSLESEV
ncbi:hypothetical protein PSEUDO8O_31000 [Pseudomonas sp. 8O]|nr:hypothetical protein PSEUDO8O_31000 [Pseudomonas sp. 8O]